MHMCLNVSVGTKQMFTYCKTCFSTISQLEAKQKNCLRQPSNKGRRTISSLSSMVKTIRLSWIVRNKRWLREDKEFAIWTKCYCNTPKQMVSNDLNQEANHWCVYSYLLYVLCIGGIDVSLKSKLLSIWIWKWNFDGYLKFSLFIDCKSVIHIDRELCYFLRVLFQRVIIKFVIKSKWANFWSLQVGNEFWFPYISLE